MKRYYERFELLSLGCRGDPGQFQHHGVILSSHNCGPSQDLDCSDLYPFHGKEPGPYSRVHRVLLDLCSYPNRLDLYALNLQLLNNLYRRDLALHRMESHANYYVYFPARARIPESQIPQTFQLLVILYLWLDVQGKKPSPLFRVS